MSLRRWVPVLLLATALAPACAELDSSDKGDEEELPSDGKLDSFAHPTEHGPIAFGAPVDAALSSTARYLTWTFALTGDASIHTFTGPALTSRKVIDTVLYLYKQKADGTWGAYIARNDAAGGSLFSTIDKNLGAGTYRVLVKGYAASTVGQFSITVGCTGAGCAAPVTCLFGSTFGDLLAGTAYTITGDRELHVTDPLSALDQARVIAAVHESSHTDVTTVEQAFAAVDGQVIRRVDIYDGTGGRAYVAFEYGAGDNSYGAVFGYGSATVVSQIHDGDLYQCTARAQTCALGPDWSTTRTGGAFTQISANVVTAAGQLAGADATDALAAIRVAYPEATSAA